MRRNLMMVAIAAVFTLGLSIGVTSAQGNTKDDKPKSLYHRLGGKKGIEKVVNDFIANVGADNRINHYFADTVKDKKRLEKFEDNLEGQICLAAGGPCKYKGKNMRAAHKGMNITEADFNALVEDPDFEYLIIDSTIVRAHQHAAGAKGGATMRRSGVRAAA